MAKNLLIVESPAKAKTINKYLGDTFSVLASFGHIRDLESKNDAIDVNNNFEMHYALVERNQDKVSAIKRAAKYAENIYLATDPDREGEAISWHILEVLKQAGLDKGKRIVRCTFSEITPAAIKNAVANPREIIQDLVDAQQARRALDFLVGFNLSPVLWRKVQRGLSAGRVQSPALRLIVDRDAEIQKFDPQEYWSLAAASSSKGQNFTAKATRLDGQPFKQFTLTNEADATAARKRVLAEANGKLVVEDIVAKDRRRNPSPPFTTSTLQQEAARKLGLSTKRTMEAAQRLYEGVNINGDTVGLITYMRTDSVYLSAEAIEDIRSVAVERYGRDYVPGSPISHANKSKNAQEAHEAVRPSSLKRIPEHMAQYLDGDMRKLYDLIWKRTMASQMSPAQLKTVSVDLSATDKHQFRVSGTTVVFPGFLAAYEEGKDSKSDEDDDMDRKLPPLEKGQVLNLSDVLIDQHYTQPPARFTEAALVKALEEYGIGRPSTYAAIIQTLLNRKYVEMDGKAFVPTDVGRAVVNFLSAHFTQYVRYDFTAGMEDDLDAVSRGEKNWLGVLREFWEPFIALIKEKSESVSRLEATGGRELGKDPKTGRLVSAKLGKHGPYVMIGTREDEEKPLYASIREGQTIASITLEEALALFGLPRNLGEYKGHDLIVNIGPRGPYVKLDKTYASLEDGDDPYTIERDRAIVLIDARLEFFKNLVIKEFPKSTIQILNGQYGPYIKDSKTKKFGKIPKGTEPTSLTLEDCQRLIEETASRPAGGGKRFGKKKFGKR